MKRLKFLLLPVFAITFIGSLKAQRYQEPQWKIGLYFEDATGAKDTIWIGYDPDATRDIDPQFDEGWKWIDTTKFNVYQWGYPNYSPQYGDINTDSVRKTDIQEDYGSIGGGVGFIKGVLPISITWDEDKLNSPDLPVEWFPNISPRPRARIDMWFGLISGTTDPDCLVIYDGPTLVLTSYTNELGMYPCVKSDSVVFDNSNTSVPNHAFAITDIVIVPHDYNTLDVATVNQDEIKVYPNIFEENFYIENKNCENYNFRILTINGKEILKGNIEAQTEKQIINMSEYPQGIYFINFFNNKNNFTYKLFKT